MNEWMTWQICRSGMAANLQRARAVRRMMDRPSWHVGLDITVNVASAERDFQNVLFGVQEMTLIYVPNLSS